MACTKPHRWSARAARAFEGDARLIGSSARHRQRRSRKSDPLNGCVGIVCVSCQPACRCVTTLQRSFRCPSSRAVSSLAGPAFCFSIAEPQPPSGHTCDCELAWRIVDGVPWTRSFLGERCQSSEPREEPTGCTNPSKPLPIPTWNADFLYQRDPDHDCANNEPVTSMFFCGTIFLSHPRSRPANSLVFADST